MVRVKFSFLGSNLVHIRTFTQNQLEKFIYENVDKISLYEEIPVK